MRAMQVMTLGGPEALVEMHLPEPELGPHQVLIEVRAIGCNFADILICQGKYQIKPELPFAPGSEVAGVVSRIGADVTTVRPGQAVFATMPFGGYATKAVADAAEVYLLPDDMPLVDAAGFGVAYLTSYLALVDRAQMRAGEIVLVHAAAGGVGLAALQITVALGGRVIASASSEEKRALCTRYGAYATLDYRDENWPSQVLELTEGHGADVIYDPVGGDTFDRSTRCIAFDGRILVVGFASGRIPDIKLNRVMLKNIAVVGFHIGSYRVHRKARLQEAMGELMALHARGEVRPVISQTYPLTEAAQALQAISDRRTTGKVVLVP